MAEVRRRGKKLSGKELPVEIRCDSLVAPDMARKLACASPPNFRGRLALAPVQHHVGGVLAVCVPFNDRLTQPPGQAGGPPGGHCPLCSPGPT